MLRARPEHVFRYPFQTARVQRRAKGRQGMGQRRAAVVLKHRIKDERRTCALLRVKENVRRTEAARTLRHTQKVVVVSGESATGIVRNVAGLSFRREAHVARGQGVVQRHRRRPAQDEEAAAGIGQGGASAGLIVHHGAVVQGHGRSGALINPAAGNSAMFPERVVFTAVASPKLHTPPPFSPAVFAERVLSYRLSGPMEKMPPPFKAVLPAMVHPRAPRHPNPC